MAKNSSTRNALVSRKSTLGATDPVMSARLGNATKQTDARTALARRVSTLT